MNDLLEQYAELVSFLGKVIGESGEVALLDLRSGDGQIVAIANGHVSGRNVGAPITDLALQIVAEGSWKTCNYITNYTGRTQDGRNLRSSTFFVKRAGKLLGMLCINIDVSAYQALSSAILKLGGLLLPEEPEAGISSVKETFANGITSAIDSSLRDLFGTPLVAAERLSMNEKMGVIRYLDQNGIFRIKGAVSILAQKLQCSQPTIYRYLSRLNKEKNG